MKNVGAVILGLEALRSTRGQEGATEVSTAIDMCLWLRDRDFKTQAVILDRKRNHTLIL